jgi:hypothetical protein
MGEHNYRSFVKPDVARQLKLLGFDSVCEYYYLNIREPMSRFPGRWYKFPENWNGMATRVSCPTYPEALRWFFEKKKLFASIRISPLGLFYYEIWIAKELNDWRMIAFSNAIEQTQIDKIHEDCLNRLIEIANK